MLIASVCGGLGHTQDEYGHQPQAQVTNMLFEDCVVFTLSMYHTEAVN